MKDGKILIVLALIGVAVWMFAKGKFTFTPTKAATTTTNSKSPITDPAPTDWQLISEKPPSDVKLNVVGTLTYAKFTQPLALGDTGFTQWGVTDLGVPVVSKNPPDSYDPGQWAFG